MAASLERSISSWNINPQINSKLFNYIPTEIRLKIFEYSFTPIIVDLENIYNPTWRQDENYTVVDDDEDSPYLSSYDLNYCFHRPYRSWARPGFPKGFHILSLGLIGTCRRALVEARPLVFSVERILWDAGQPLLPGHERPYYGPFKAWGRQRSKWERCFTRVHMLGHVRCAISALGFELEGERVPWYPRIEHLHITTPESDYLNGQESAVFNPFGYTLEMQESMRITKDFDLATALASSSRPSSSDRHSPSRDSRPPWFPPFKKPTKYGSIRGSWGLWFLKMPRIKTFKLTLDAREHRRAEVEPIIEWALRTWQLPLNPQANGGWHYLSPELDKTKRLSWTVQARNPDGRTTCSACLANDHDDSVGWPPRGPNPWLRLYSWTITWTRRKYDGPEVFPYGDTFPFPKSHYEDEDDELSDIDVYNLEDEYIFGRRIGYERI